MNLNINPKTNKPIKVLWFGDLVVLSGFGRIGNEITKRLRQRGYDVQGVGISYSGWPHDLSGGWVWPLAGQDIWNNLVAIVQQMAPDVLISCQDFPYHQTLWNGCRIDFSKLKWIWITPIDGVPIHPEWLNLCQWADGKMVISKFGVEAMRQAGQRVSLCHPGVDAKEFYPAEGDERRMLRELAGFKADDYIVGVVCMNQGRKAIPPMIEGFMEFARDKPNARLYLDMDKISAGGWDIPNLLKQMNYSETDQKRVIFREDAWKSAQEKQGKPDHDLLSLRNRYVLMDVHMVISHREGFGLPLLESMACQIPTMALDYCSGTEIVGEGRGILIRRIDYMEYGTWGGARDAFPDVKQLAVELSSLYYSPEHAAILAATGYAWAKQQTWDAATDAVEQEIQNAFKHERIVSHEPSYTATNSAGLSDNRAPAHDERNHSELQPTRSADSMPEVAVQDELAVRPAEPPGDHRTG